MISKKLILIVGVILAIIAIMVGCYILSGTSEYSDNNNEKVDAGFISLSAGHALLFIAQEKGYFVDEGLDVELFEFQTANDQLIALSSGKIDVAVAGIGEPLIQMDNGKNFTFIGGVDNGDHAVIAKNESISEELRENPDAYKKYTIGTVSGIPQEIISLGYLKEKGIDKKDLNIIDFRTAPDVINGIKSGKVDVGFVYPAFQYSAQKDGLSIVNFSNEIIPNLPDCRIAINAEDLNENTEDKWISYTKALIRAYDFYMTNHDETLEIVSKYIPLTGEELEIATYNDNLSLDTDPNIKGTEKFYDLLVSIDYVKGNVDVASHFNTDVYKKALDAVFEEDPNNPNYLHLKELFETQN